MNPSEPHVESSRAAMQRRVCDQVHALQQPGAQLTTAAAAQLLEELRQCVAADKDALTRAARPISLAEPLKSFKTFKAWRQNDWSARNRKRILQFLQDRAGLEENEAKALLFEIDPPKDSIGLMLSAARNGDIATVQRLAEVHPEERDLAVIVAARNGHLEVVQLLLSTDGFNPRDAFRNAAAFGQTHVVRELLNNAHLNQFAYDSALYHATRNGYFDVVDVLLAHGVANPYHVVDQTSALELVVQNGDLRRLQKILADERITGEALYFGIGAAAMSGQASLIPMLMAHPRFEPETNLDLLCSGNLDAVRAYYAHPDCRNSIDVVGAVGSAVLAGHVDIAKLMLAFVNAEQRSAILKAVPPDNVRKIWVTFKKSFTKNAVELRVLDCLHVLLRLPLEHVPARRLLQEAHRAAKLNIDTEALVQLHEEGQLLAALRDVFNIRLTPPCVDEIGQARGALAPFAAVSKAATLQAGGVILDVRVIPDVLYALAPALPRAVVRDIWEMLRAQAQSAARATQEGSPAQRMQPVLVRNVIIRAVDLALSKYREAQQDAATLAHQSDAELKAVAQAMATHLDALGRALETADADALQEAQADVSEILPEYKRQIKRVFGQEGLDRRGPSFDLLRSIIETKPPDLAAFAAAQKRQRQASKLLSKGL